MQESAVYQDLSRPQFQNVFDLTITYRHNSDVFYKYGALVNKTTKEKIKPNEFLEYKHQAVNLTEVTELSKRQKDIAWVVSHCQTPSHREQYVEKMRQHKSLQIDVFGKCGSLTLSRDSGVGESYRKLASEYKFYLSFENAKCFEYITEKFFLALEFGMIPVAMGGLSRQDYEQVAPPHSFVHVDDFSSAQELMWYLDKLSKDSEQYHSYFWWKPFYEFHHKIGTEATCGFCDLLNVPNFSSKNDYKDFTAYWNKCR